MGGHMLESRRSAVPLPGATVELSDLARRILNGYQHGFPLDPEPFAVIAAELESSELAVLAALRELEDVGVLSRIGSVVETGRLGASTLAAMAVPPARLEAVAAVVGAHPEVNHNYAREHEINLWFVVVAPDEDRLQAVLASIAAETGLDVLDLRMETNYHIDLGFTL